MANTDVFSHAWDLALPHLLTRLHVADGTPVTWGSGSPMPSYGLSQDTDGHVWLSIPEGKPGSGYAVRIDAVDADAEDATVEAYRVRDGQQQDVVWSSAHGAQHPAAPGTDQDLAGWLSYVAWQTVSGRSEELGQFDPAAPLADPGQGDTTADTEPEA